MSDELFRALWIEGATIGKIAHLTGIPIGSVSRVAANLGLRPRKYPGVDQELGIMDDPLLKRLNEVHPR